MLLLVFLLGIRIRYIDAVVIAAHADQACPSACSCSSLQRQESSVRSAWPLFRDATLPASARADLIARLTLEEAAALLTFDSHMVERLGGTQFDGGQSMRG